MGPTTGLSASTIGRLLWVWQTDYEEWRKGSLEGKDYVYIWADVVYFKVWTEEDRRACLVIIGVLPDGTKDAILPLSPVVRRRLGSEAITKAHRRQDTCKRAIATKTLSNTPFFTRCFAVRRTA